MRFLYHIGIVFLGIGMRIAARFNKKASQWVEGRKHNPFPDQKLLQSKEVIWFHCASLGEFDQGLPLMKQIKTHQPQCFLLVTFFSPSGMLHYHKREHPVDHVMYLPLDTSRNAKQMVQHIQPSKVFFVKYEFWGNHIDEIKRSGASLYNVSGIFRPNHRFFKWYGSFFRHMLRKFDWFFVQNEASIRLLHSIGIKECSLSGDSRYDRVMENAENFQENPVLLTFQNNEPLLVIGSSWQADEELWFPIVSTIPYKILIAPHSIEPQVILSIQAQLKDALRYSALKETDCLESAKYLILDTIGELTNAYYYGTMAYVGGGFSGNLHNILEPAAFGLPVLFGPKHQRFPEAQLFIDEGIGFSVSNPNEAIETLKMIGENHDEIRQKNRRLMQAQRGSTAKIIAKVFNAN